MGMLDRLRGRRRVRSTRPGGGGKVAAEDSAHLNDFLVSRRGVEGFVEPRTAISDVTLMLVAHDGEWTRRAVPSVEWAHSFANSHGIPSYDAAVVGYPDRMRAFNRRRKEGYSGS